jgi:hypothetical protein
MTDLDLWVAESELPAFADQLAGLGYRPDPLYPAKFHRAGTTVDVRTHLLWADRIRSRKRLLAAAPEAIFRRTRTVDLDGRPARVLDGPDQLVYLALHALKHGVDRLLWLFDIRQAMTADDTARLPAVLDRAVRWGMQRPVAWVLGAMQQSGFSLDGPGPPVTGPFEVHLLRRWEKTGRLPPGAPEWILCAGKPLPLRLIHMLEVLFPAKTVIRQVYGAGGGVPAGPLYLRRAAEVVLGGRFRPARKRNDQGPGTADGHR